MLSGEQSGGGGGQCNPWLSPEQPGSRGHNCDAWWSLVQGSEERLSAPPEGKMKKSTRISEKGGWRRNTTQDVVTVAGGPAPPSHHRVPSYLAQLGAPSPMACGL